MVTPRIGLKLPTTDDRPSVPADKSAAEWGQYAEQLGFDSIWMSEAWGADALVSLTNVAAQTESIRLCTAIVNIYSRTPPVLAMAAATLQQLSDDRVVLGVGASHAAVIESLHGVEYDQPVRRSHETIELVKQLTANEGQVTYNGEIFQLQGYPGFGTDVPVYNAALGEANRRATGRVADGWLPYLFPLSALQEGFETIENAALEAGRDPDTIEVTPQILTAVDDDPEDAKDHIRAFVASYIGTLPNYRNALSTWFPEESNAIETAWEDGGLNTAMEEVTDTIVEELGIAGTPDAVQDRVAQIVDMDLIDCPILYVPRSTSPTIRRKTIETVSPNAL